MRQNIKCFLGQRFEIPEGYSSYRCWMLVLLQLHNPSMVQA